MFEVFTFASHLGKQGTQPNGDRIIRTCFSVVFIACLIAVGPVHAGPPAKEEHWCIKVGAELKQKQQRLKEYRDALRAALANNDSPLCEALKHKIKQETEEVRILERESADCAAHDPTAMAQGLRAAKTEESKYATKSCGELRKLVFPLLIRERALKRKEKSLLSVLTPEEETDLATCSEQLRVIGHLLRTRCAERRSRNSLLKRLRR